MIDIHSHILPETDDGSRTLKEALEMARVAVADGIEQMVCTPHMFNGISGNPEPSEVLERVARLQDAVRDIGLTVLPGNEVHLTHDIVHQTASDRVTRINGQNYMLVEFPALTVPEDAQQLFDGLQLINVRPILVHPERNAQLQARRSMVAEFVERGVYVQVTAMSVTGEFGSAAKNCAESLLRHNCVHFLATDAHRAERRPPVLSRGREAAADIIGSAKARKLVYDNPLAVIQGKPLEIESPVPYVPHLKGRISFFGRFFGR